MDSEDLDLTPFFIWNNVEGEEHIPKLLLNEIESQSDINLATDTRVPGRTKGQHEFYKNIGANPYICNVVKNGYKLEFDELPPTSFTENNKSALQKPDFMLKELLRLEELGCIERVLQKTHCGFAFVGGVFQKVEVGSGCEPYTQPLLPQEKD